MIKPYLTEKTYSLASVYNKYTFITNEKLSKVAFADWVSSTYKVEVLRVNKSVVAGKKKFDYKSRVWRRASDKFKYVVTLKQGDKIKEFFEVK